MARMARINRVIARDLVIEKTKPTADYADKRGSEEIAKIAGIAKSEN